MTDILMLKVESALLEGEAHRLRMVSVSMGSGLAI